MKPLTHKNLDIIEEYFDLVESKDMHPHEAYYKVIKYLNSLGHVDHDVWEDIM